MALNKWKWNGGRVVNIDT